MQRSIGSGDRGIRPGIHFGGKLLPDTTIRFAISSNSTTAGSNDVAGAWTGAELTLGILRLPPRPQLLDFAGVAGCKTRRVLAHCLRDIGRSEVAVVLLDHAGGAVAQVLRDYD